MRGKPLVFWFLISILPLALLGCVELQGQCISIYHDQEQDRLLLLLHYDGIHDSGSDSDGNGVEQIQKTARDGDLMLLDWYFHLDMRALEEDASNEGNSPAERALAKALLDQVTTFPLGTFRDIDGRIGAIQAIEVSHVSELVDLSNRMIRAGEEGEEESASRPEDMGVGAGVWLEGHSVKIRCRLDDVASNASEREGFAKWLERVRKAPKPAPLSVLEDGEWLTFTVGLEDTPSTVRINLRPDYEPSLEAALEESVPRRIDEKLLPLLLGGTSESRGPEASWLERLAEWGPPEEQVRVMLAAAREESGEKRDQALAWLEKWGSRLEKGQALPSAREPSKDRDAYLRAWEDWCRQVHRFPWWVE